MILRRRTLSHIKRPLDRLIYLASTRDYNTGFYYTMGSPQDFRRKWFAKPRRLPRQPSGSFFCRLGKSGGSDG